VVPSFYDSIEISRDRMIAKYRRRVPKRGVALAFLQTAVEAVLTLLLVRFVWRLVLRVWRRLSGRGHPPGSAPGSLAGSMSGDD
jgi:hypothetical protein